MKCFFAIAIACLLPVLALAESGTYEVTFTALGDDGSVPGAPIDGHNAYEGCDLSTQQVGAQIAADAQVGTPYTFAGDSTAVPVVCAVTFNSSTSLGPTGNVGEGGFAEVYPLAVNVPLPSKGTAILSCKFITDTGQELPCTIQLGP